MARPLHERLRAIADQLSMETIRGQPPNKDAFHRLRNQLYGVARDMERAKERVGVHAGPPWPWPEDPPSASSCCGSEPCHPLCKCDCPPCSSQRRRGSARPRQRAPLPCERPQCSVCAELERTDPKEDR